MSGPYESKIFRVVQYEPLLNIDVKNFIGNTYAFSLTINVGTASTNVNSGNYYYRGTYIDYITNANGDIFQYNPNATNAND